MFETIAGWIGFAIEAMGIAIIVVGALISTWRFLHDWVSAHGFENAYSAYRTNLGRAILLGLEFLVAADIVGTVVVDPTFENLGVLGLLVLIRTGLSFALEVEINGHWPWQQRPEELRSSSVQTPRERPK
jgi:uncharacterized membrane protein